MEWQRVRSTQSDGVTRGIRVVLGALFVMTGAMKLVVPMLAAAWAGQLAAANIPLPELNRWVVPFIETNKATLQKHCGAAEIGEGPGEEVKDSCVRADWQADHCYDEKMRFVISYKKDPRQDDPKSRILISVFYVERNEKPSMEEVLKIVEKHSGNDFIPDSIEVKDGYV